MNRMEHSRGGVMHPSDILAVVISFNGGEQLLATVQEVKHQVGRVLVVDNGSGVEAEARLAELVEESRVEVVKLGANRGIGAALNIGLRWALETGHKWLLTMDQDSLMSPDFTERYAEAVGADSQLVCLTPALVIHGEPCCTSDGEVPFAITSGNLVRVDVLEAIGGFDEIMFIDGVDFDFCLRLRANGHVIRRVGAARLIHALGAPHQVPQPFARFYTRHSPLRRYYMFRNFCLLAKRYGLRFPRFVLGSLAAHLILLPLIAIYDEQRCASLKAAAWGIADGLCGRFGPCRRTFG